MELFKYNKGLKPRHFITGEESFKYDRDVCQIFLETEQPIVVDPILENNSWEVIRDVCEYAEAENFWAVGDTKVDVGSDEVNRTMRICDMAGLYGKSVVFEQVEQESTTYVWNPSTNTDGDGAYNDYDIADIRTSLNTTIKGYYSSALQSALTQTTVKVAKSGYSLTILDVTDYLFLPAEKEIFGIVSYSRTEEANVLTQYQWYNAHNTNNDRIKQRGGQNKSWWLRSPNSGNGIRTCMVAIGGTAIYSDSSNGNGLAPCFSF